jgi:hypothetical protein
MRKLLPILLLLFAVACSDDDDPTTEATDDTTEEAADTTADPADDEASDDTTADSTPADGECAVDDLEAEALEEQMITDVEGFELQEDDVADTGPSDLDKAIGDDGLEDAEEALTDAGFRRGYQRLWSSEDEGDLLLVVMEFCDSEGASTYAARGPEAVEAQGLELTAFDPEGGGEGFFVENQGVLAVFVSQIAGSTFVQSIHYATEESDQDEVQARAAKVVVDQVARLQ